MYKKEKLELSQQLIFQDYYNYTTLLYAPSSRINNTPFPHSIVCSNVLGYLIAAKDLNKTI
ncbi:hypothetical protein TSAR_010153 [Trichomalopsis sarcophagae]|uniref:Uncharacterized protein n=1 Tax=Trichomalopsis sarcophagae TaxID=543379 RepID=A0A232ERE0_9HYME|nr:hypothetical protein TSAR_010153 [Trichomalopsis sarcophagae]